MRKPLTLSIALALQAAAFAAAAHADPLDATAASAAIPAMPLQDALNAFARQSGLQIAYVSNIADNARTHGAPAGLSNEARLRALLDGSGLAYRFVNANTVTIYAPSAAPTNTRAALQSSGTAPADASLGDAAAAEKAAPAREKSGKEKASGEQASNGMTNMDQVVVTARAGVGERTKEQTSYSITTIDEDRLRMQAPTSVTEALKSVPGFWVESSGGEASGNVRARGIPVDGYGSINLLEDGIPVQHDPALGYLNADQAFRLDETIDRIEVVRGGPSSIFYSNAPAGAVNFIPREAGEEASGLFKYTVGDYGLNRTDFWYGTPLGDGWKVAFGGFYRSDDGIRDPGFTADQGGQLRATLSKEWDSGKFSVDVKRLDDKVYFDLGIPMRTYADGSIRAVPGFDGNSGTLAGPETENLLLRTATGEFPFDNSKGTDVNRTQTTFKFEQAFAGDWRFQDSLRLNHTNEVRNGVYPNTLQSATTLLQQGQQYLSQFPGAVGLQLRYVDSPNTVFDNQNQNGNGLTVVGGLRSVTSPVDEIMNDARVSTKLDLAGSHDVSFGYYYANVDQDFSRYSSTVLMDVQNNARLLNMVAVDASGNVVGTLTSNGVYRNGYEWADASGHSTTNAVYFSDEWQVSEPLRIDLGARWEKVDIKGSTEGSQTVNLNDGSLADSQILTGTGQFTDWDHSYDKLGWTIGANWQFDSHSGLFARWTPTFRLPNISTYMTTPTATGITQTMDLGEIGYKYANRFVEFYATAFYTKYNNVAFNNYVFDLNTGVSTQQQGFANTKAYGLELEGGLYPVDWFDLTFNATLQDPEYKNLIYTTAVNGQPVLLDYVDNQLIRVPKTSLRLVPGFNLLDGKLRVQFSAEYEGKRYVDTANSVVLPAYKTYNVSARYDVNDRISLFGYADNITNSLGLTEGNPRAGELNSADAGANTFLARPLLGRSYRLAFMYKF
jgi:outer membrane receptor protein involved in Fe transport